MQEGVCAQPRSQRSALPVSMEPSWCAPATPPLISLSHPSSSPEYAVRSPRKVSHCNDDFSRREAGRQQGEEVSCVRHCAWEPGARLAHHNEKLESLPLEGAALISPASLPIPEKSDGCPDGVKKAFRQSVWRACFKSSAIDAVARGREKGLSAKSRNWCKCFWASSSSHLPPAPSQQAQHSVAVADGERQTSSDFHPIDCLAKALHLLTGFHFFLSVGQLSCPLWRSPFCQPALVHPCPVHANQTIPQRQDKEKGN